MTQTIKTVLFSALLLLTAGSVRADSTAKDTVESILTLASLVGVTEGKAEATCRYVYSSRLLPERDDPTSLSCVRFDGRIVFNVQVNPMTELVYDAIAYDVASLVPKKLLKVLGAPTKFVEEGKRTKLTWVRKDYRFLLVQSEVPGEALFRFEVSFTDTSGVPHFD